MDFEPYIIQGKKSPIKLIDEIPIGVKINNSGNYTIAISSLDGDFQNYNTYLMDTTLNTVHNLKESPYSFTSNTGTFNYRFKIIFNYKLNIKRVIIYDMMAKKIFEGNFDSYRNTTFDKNSILIVKFEMEDGSVMTKKVLGI
jgi:hypothetical protein